MEQEHHGTNYMSRKLKKGFYTGKIEMNSRMELYKFTLSYYYLILVLFIQLATNVVSIEIH